MKRTIIKLTIVALFALVLFSTTNLNTIDAKGKTQSEQKVLFNETITITNKTSKFDIGFVRVQFIKNSLAEEAYPITFDVSVYAENGELFIEFDPDVEVFFKDVIIHVYKYDGFIYDVALDDFIYVEVPNSVFKVPHFSRWCFFR